MRKNKNILTTGDVAEILSVSTHTVGVLCDSGKLKSYRINESSDRSQRRIMAVDLEEYVKRNGIPFSVPGAGKPLPTVLVVCFDERVFSKLRSEKFSFVYVETLFMAGVLFERTNPVAVVIYVDEIGYVDSGIILSSVKKLRPFVAVKVYAVSSVQLSNDLSKYDRVFYPSAIPDISASLEENCNGK